MFKTGVFACLLLALTAPAGARSPGPWEFGFGFSVTGGDYGTDTNTTITYLPFTFRRLFTRGHIDGVVPFVRMTTDGRVTLVGGQPNRFDPSGGSVRPRTTEGGLGDMLVRGRLDVWRETDVLPDVSLTARIKFPTADEDKGLGTGEFDETLGIEFWKTLTGPWSALADFSYTWTGDPPGRVLRDAWGVGLGAAYTFRRDLVGTATYEESRALVAGEPNPRDLVFGVAFTGLRSIRLNGSLQFGLSNGSPDLGIGAGVAVRWPRD